MGSFLTGEKRVGHRWWRAAAASINFTGVIIFHGEETWDTGVDVRPLRPLRGKTSRGSFRGGKHL